MYHPEAFAKVLKLVIGKRTTNQFSKDTGVDGGYISRMLRMKLKNPPSAGIIARLAHNSTPDRYEQMLKYAGYLSTASSEEANWLQEIAAAPKEKQQLIQQLWNMIREI